MYVTGKSRTNAIAKLIASLGPNCDANDLTGSLYSTQLVLNANYRCTFEC